MTRLTRWLTGLLSTDSTGRRGERAAADFLRKNGYRILARNLRTRLGEIDLVAQAPDGRTIVIVEVKTTAMDQPGTVVPEVHVNRAKQRKLVSLASLVARRHGWTDRPIRFDVIGVELRRGQPPVIRHHPGAFESHV